MEHHSIPTYHTDKYFPAFCKDYSHYLLAHVYVYVFCSGFDCIIILNFCLYCVLSCFVCMYYYVSMALMWSYVYCSGVEEWCLPSTKVETINQSINQ